MSFPGFLYTFMPENNTEFMTTIIILSLCIVLLGTGLVVTVFLAHPFRRKSRTVKEETIVEEPANRPEDLTRVPDRVKASDRELYVRCCRYMELRKPFLVETFSMEDLANALFTNKLYLSQTINVCSGRNFRNYVNSYRVMYAMELFKKNNRLRVTDLANLSGFHTPVTFNMAFKLVMDESPGAWCNRIRIKNQRKQKTVFKDQ